MPKGIFLLLMVYIESLILAYKPENTIGLVSEFHSAPIDGGKKTNTNELRFLCAPYLCSAELTGTNELYLVTCTFHEKR